MTIRGLVVQELAQGLVREPGPALERTVKVAQQRATGKAAQQRRAMVTVPGLVRVMARARAPAIKARLEPETVKALPL